MTIKRLLSLFLVMALMLPMVPAATAADQSEPVTVLTQEDYASADAVFAEIQAMEKTPAKKNASQTEKTDAAAALVKKSDGYVAGSLERNGDSFTWWTEDGVRCIYSPYMNQKRENMVAPADAAEGGIYNEPTATKGGWPTGKEVYLIGPYYGLDSSFTSQYKNEARDIAAAIGDTDGYTLYSGTAATVDKVAEAISNGAVVIFDSHGSTDYVDPNADLYDDYEDDYVTGANYSYLCLSTYSGLTNQDYQDGAAYSTYGDAFVNGQVIANHMTSPSPAGLVWMAICLGMATDTLCGPLREMGVEVVYGYSQSVTFGGDYCFEDIFWDNLCSGTDVAAAISAMKSRYGDWDQSSQICSACGWSGAYTSISAARANYAAFPIVVSDEDAHPGQRNKSGFYGADSLQTVQSTYTLFSQYAITARSNNTAYGTVSVSGSTVTAMPATGYFAEGYTLLSGSATVTQNGNRFYVLAESDCEIQINFAPKTPVTVQFSGADVPSQNGYAGDEMTLPAVTAPEGYKFLGWTTAPLTDETTEKPSFYTGSFIPTESTTLYALYSYVISDSGTGTGDYVKVTEEPDNWSGEYLIVYEDEVLVFDGSLGKLDATNNYQMIDMYDYTFPAEEGDPYRFVIEAVDGGYTIQSTGGQYIGKSTNDNGLESGSSPMVNTITMSADESVNIIGSGGAYLRFNATQGQMRFRYYKSSTYANQHPIHLYKKDGSGGTVIYTSTTAAAHEHVFTDYVYNEDATCTENGTQTAKCQHCSATDTRTAENTALGHDHKATVTDPKCTEQGYTTHTCTRCGDSYVDTYVDPLEHDYVAVVTPPTASNQGYTTHTCSRCGHSYVDTYTDPTGPNQITSTTASVAGGYISKIAENTKASTLLATLAPGGDYTVTKAGTPVASNALVGTGMVISLYRNGQVIDSVIIVVTGDVSGDGKITITDMLAVKSHVLSKSTLKNAYAKAGDTNGDGKITITDFIQLKAKILDKGTITPR